MALYGDLVNALAHTGCLPAYLWMARSASANNLDAFTWEPWVVNGMFLLSAIICWASYLTDNLTLSHLGCLAAMVECAALNLTRWPHAEENLLTEQLM